MAKMLGLALRDRLGEHGTRELNELVERPSEALKTEVKDMCNARLTGMTMEITAVKNELLARMGDLKVDLTEKARRDAGRIVAMDVGLLDRADRDHDGGWGCLRDGFVPELT